MMDITNIKKYPQETPEAKCVKELDHLDLIMQAREQKEHTDLEP
jgi:hypothetical protein